MDIDLQSAVRSIREFEERMGEQLQCVHNGMVSVRTLGEISGFHMLMELGHSGIDEADMRPLMMEFGIGMIVGMFSAVEFEYGGLNVTPEQDQYLQESIYRATSTCN